MPRTPAYSDEQILKAAESLLTERRLAEVTGYAVWQKLGGQGGPDRVKKLVDAWRQEKDAAAAEPAPVGEVMAQRSGALEDQTNAVVEALRALVETANKELDRVAAEERRKSDRVRADDRSAHEAALSEQVAALDAARVEAQGLAEALEAESSRCEAEEERANAAEAKARSLEKKLEAANATLAAAKEDLARSREDVSTARVDLATARSERARADDRLKQQSELLAATRAELAEERKRSAAWSKLVERSRPRPVTPPLKNKARARIRK